MHIFMYKRTTALQHKVNINVLLKYITDALYDKKRFLQ